MKAHARKLPVAVHLYYLADAKATLLAGADLIAHSVRDVPVDDQFINALKSRDVCYSPTLTREISTFIYDATPSWVDDPFFLKGAEKGVPEQLKDPKRQEQIRNSPAWKAGSKTRPASKWQRRNLKTLVDRGVRIALAPTPARRCASRDSSSTSTRNDGRRRHDADAGDRVGYRRCPRCRHKAGQIGTLASGRGRRSVDPEREPARQHPQHAEHRLGVDQREKSVLSQID